MTPRFLRNHVLIGLCLVLSSVASIKAQGIAVDPSLSPYVPSANVSGSVDAVTGMDSVEGMMAAWNDAFKKYHPGANFTVTSKDTAPEERLALGPNTAEVFHPDNQAYEDTYGYEPFRIRFCMGAFILKSHVSAIGVYVNEKNPIKELSLAQLDALYSTERRRGYPADITTWGQLGLTGEWADKPVHINGFYWRDDVTAYFRKLVMFDAPFRASYTVPGEGMGRNTPKVAKDLMTTLATDPYAIGYANFSYLTGPVKAIGLSDSNGVIAQPNLTDISSGRYPLERYLYFYVNRRPGQPIDPLIKEFLLFVLSKDGQSLVEKDHYLPLTAAAVAEERAKLN